jgi:hypothetical protein
MAEATFILRAVDATRQAFASVQNSIQKLGKESAFVGGALKKAFNVRALGMAAVVASGVSLANIFSKITELAISAITRVGDVQKILKESAASVQEIYKETYRSIMVDEDKYQSYLKDREQLQKKINKLAVDEVVIRKVAALGMTGVSMATVQTTNLTKEQAEELRKLRIEYANLDAIMIKMGISSEAQSEKERTEAATNALREQTEVIRDQRQEDVEREQAAFDFSQQFAASMRKAAEAVEESDQELKNLGDSLRQSAMTPLEEYTAVLERLSTLREAGIITLETEGALIAQAAQGYAEAVGPLEDMSTRLFEVGENTERILPEMSKLAQFAENAGNMIAFGFEDAIFSGQKLSEVLKQLGLDLVRLVFQNVVTAPLATGIGNLISGVRADGGPVNSGRSYLVGERGPELFVPGSSGSIVPNDAMRSGGGGGGPSVNITYNIAAGVTKSELGPILESERRRLKAEIPDMVRRGGAYRAAFA